MKVDSILRLASYIYSDDLLLYISDFDQCREMYPLYQPDSVVRS